MHQGIKQLKKIEDWGGERENREIAHTKLRKRKKKRNDKKSEGWTKFMEKLESINFHLRSKSLFGVFHISGNDTELKICHFGDTQLQIISFILCNLSFLKQDTA